MKSTLVNLLMQCLMSVVLLPGFIGLPQESEQVVTINLVRPGEGETFYAGPSSLLYNIPIHGWVESDLYRTDEIKVVLAIYQNSGLVLTQETLAEANGEFEFYATVNPDGSIEKFPAVHADCSSYCHYLSELVLPAGKMTLELTSIDPAGNQDRVERHIIVDRSGYAYLPLQVVLKGSGPSGRALTDIPVSASTRVYMWRGRNFLASTDDQGFAEIRIEALAESPTHYRIQVEPTIVEGVLYYSGEPVEISLPPGATASPAITLDVKTSTGNISGNIMGMDESLASSARVLAIRPLDGVSYSESISPQGKFEFDDIPLYEYMIVPDLEHQTRNQGFTPEIAKVNLVESQSASLEFATAAIAGTSLPGEVRGEEGNPLPFAWITNEELAITQRVMVDSGRFELHGLPDNSGTFIINAPGYYSLATSLDPVTDQPLDFSPILVRRPDTILVPWGNGEIVVPSESLVELSTSRIWFGQGWIWGDNQQSSEITIQHELADIILSQGRFAFESLPNRKNWLYMIEGNAVIQPSDGRPSVTIHPGEMVILIQNKEPVTIPIDHTVVTALHWQENDSSQPVWEPSLDARIRDRISRIGVGSLQMVTFITYGLILISIVGFPFTALYLNLTRRKKPRLKENNESKQ
jgi:hypothetical protein